MGADTRRILYIAGCIHSGSTLLARLLNASDAVFSTGEVNSLHSINHGNKVCACGADSLELCPHWSRVRANLLAAPDVGWDLAQVAGNLHVDAERYREFVNAICETTGAKLVVDASKDPRLAGRVASLPGLSTHIVLLYKDPRAQTASLMRKGAPLGGAIASYWKVNLRGLALRPFGRRGQVLSYERLCESPDGTVARLCAACNVHPPNLAKVDWAAQDLHLLDGNRMRFDRELVVRRDDAWRKRLTRVQAAIAVITCSPIWIALKLAESLDGRRG